MDKRTKKLAELITAYAPSRSTWQRGVRQYALDMLTYHEDGRDITIDTLLNGASDWLHYSEQGCALIYDSNILNRLATETEKKIFRRRKHRDDDENVLEIQARACGQACALILKTQSDYSDFLRVDIDA